MLNATLALLALLDLEFFVTCDLDAAVRPDGLTGYSSLAGSCLADPPGDVIFEPAMEAELARRINNARREAGLAPLAVRDGLAAPARFHSIDMAWTGPIDHESVGGRLPRDRIAALDRTLVASSSRENVSRIGGAIPPEERVEWIHSGLMNSPGHRENILAEDATHMAIGVVSRGDTYWTTQLFVTEVVDLGAPPPLTLYGGEQTDPIPGTKPSAPRDPFAALPILPPGALGEWSFEGYGVEYAGGELVKFDGATPLPKGKGQLVIRGRMADPADPLRAFIIAYPGPAITVE